MRDNNNIQKKIYRCPMAIGSLVANMEDMRGGREGETMGVRPQSSLANPNLMIRGSRAPILKK